jgi:hypothetical protein
MMKNVRWHSRRATLAKSKRAGDCPLHDIQEIEQSQIVLKYKQIKQVACLNQNNPHPHLHLPQHHLCIPNTSLSPTPPTKLYINPSKRINTTTPPSTTHHIPTRSTTSSIPTTTHPSKPTTSPTSHKSITSIFMAWIKDSISSCHASVAVCLRIAVASGAWVVVHLGVVGGT